MFSACDDFFFDLASRARSNADQNRYFESLREVRLKKTRVAADFLAGVNRDFSGLGQRTAPQVVARRGKPCKPRSRAGLARPDGEGRAGDGYGGAGAHGVAAGAVPAARAPAHGLPPLRRSAEPLRSGPNHRSIHVRGGCSRSSSTS
ncbi:MAG: DUF1631 family protein [Gammaproteobacteria bacterium]|nr:DUF1631 family protein [Gammaproteobacteria bacterium]